MLKITVVWENKCIVYHVCEPLFFLLILGEEQLSRK